MNTWIDVTVLGGALAGVLIVVGAFWAHVLLSRLWQESLYARAEPAIRELQARGLALRRPGLRARLVCEGEGLRVEWHGGVRGERSVIVRDGKRQRVPFVEDAAAV